MRPGKVVTIRVSPKDCLAVLDIMKKVGIDVKGASFPALVSLALSSMIETMKKAQQIPERDGFEYLDMMGEFLTPQRTGRKLAITSAISATDSDFQMRAAPEAARALAASEQPAAGNTLVMPEKPLTTYERQARTRLSELMAKKDLSESPSSGVVWSNADEEEFKQCYAIVYPEG